jgi:hypothetical protein
MYIYIRIYLSIYTYIHMYTNIEQTEKAAREAKDGKLHGRKKQKESMHNGKEKPSKNKRRVVNNDDKDDDEYDDEADNDDDDDDDDNHDQERVAAKAARVKSRENFSKSIQDEIDALMKKDNDISPVTEDKGKVVIKAGRNRSTGSANLMRAMKSRKLRAKEANENLDEDENENK